MKFAKVNEKYLKENYGFFDLLKFYFFPNTKIKSFNSILIGVCLIVFIATLAIDGVDNLLIRL